MTENVVEGTISNEVALNDSARESVDVVALIDNLRSGRSSVYSTYDSATIEGKLAVMDAITNSEPVADHLNKPFAWANFVIQEATLTDEKTGELRTLPRLVLIDVDGKAYHAISDGLVKSVMNYLGVIGRPGTPDWPAEGVWVMVAEVKGSIPGRKFFTLKAAPAPKK